jgi:hypothetical protein
MLLVGVVMFLFVALYGALNLQLSEQAKKGVYESLLDKAQAVQDEIGLAYVAENGYQRVFTLEPKVYGLAYNMTIVDGFIYARTLNGDFALSQPVLNVSGQLVMGPNVITKTNGIVRLNQ